MQFAAAIAAHSEECYTLVFAEMLLPSVKDQLIDQACQVVHKLFDRMILPVTLS